MPSSPRHPVPCRNGCGANVWVRPVTRDKLPAVTLAIDAAPVAGGSIAAPANGASARFLAAGQDADTVLAEQRFRPHRCPAAAEPDPPPALFE